MRLDTPGEAVLEGLADRLALHVAGKRALTYDELLDFLARGLSDIGVPVEVYTLSEDC